MHRVDTATAVATPPTQNPAGTQGYFSQGSPTGSPPATVPGQDWFNSVQEELVGVILAAGLTPSKANNAQLIAALRALFPSHGKCILNFVSTTSIKLSPLNGNKLTINGTDQAIPSAGVSIANTGLTAATLYYIYAYMDAGTMKLEASTTAHSTDATTGVEIKTGDATRTLVAATYTGAGTPGVFQSGGLTRSWFNDPGFASLGTFSADRSTASTSFVELDPEIRVYFFSWNKQVMKVCADGNSSVTGGSTGTSVGLDGATSYPGFEATGVVHFNGGPVPITSKGFLTIESEGVHYATLLGKNSGGTSVFRSATAGDYAKVYLHVSGRRR